MNHQDQASGEARFGFSPAKTSCRIQVNGEPVVAYLAGTESAYEKKRTYAEPPSYGSRQVRLSTKLGVRYRRDFDFPNELIYKHEQGESHPQQVILVRLHANPRRREDFELKLAAVLEYEALEVLQDENNIVYIVFPLSEGDAVLAFQKYFFSSTDDLETNTYPYELGLKIKWANTYHVLGLYATAAHFFEESLKSCREDPELGPKHVLTLSVIDSMARLQRKQGKLKAAEKLCKEAVEGRRIVSGPTHKDTLSSMKNLAELYSDHGMFQRAEKQLREVLKKYRENLGDDHLSTLNCKRTLADVLRRTENYEEAEKLNKEALEGLKMKCGTTHGFTLSARHCLGNLYRDMNQFDQAEKEYKEALVGREATLPSHHPETIETMTNLANILARTNKVSEAANLYKETLVRRRQRLEQLGDKIQKVKIEKTMEELNDLLIRLQKVLSKTANEASRPRRDFEIEGTVDAQLEFTSWKKVHVTEFRFGGISVTKEPYWCLKCEPLKLHFNGEDYFVFRSEMERDVYKLCLPPDSKVNAQAIGAIFLAQRLLNDDRARGIDKGFEDYTGISYFNTLKAELQKMKSGNAYVLQKTMEHPKRFRLSLAPERGLFIKSRYKCRSWVQCLAVSFFLATLTGLVIMAIFSSRAKNEVAKAFFPGLAASLIVELSARICCDPPGILMYVLSYRKVFNHEEAKKGLGIAEDDELAATLYKAGVNPYRTKGVCSPMGRSSSRAGWKFRGIRTEDLESPKRLLNLMVSADGRTIGTIDESGHFVQGVDNMHVLRQPPKLVIESSESNHLNEATDDKSSCHDWFPDLEVGLSPVDPLLNGHQTLSERRSNNGWMAAVAHKLSGLTHTKTELNTAEKLE